MRFILIALGGLLGAALLVLLLRARVSVRVSLHFAQNAVAELHIRFLFGLIQIRRTYVLHILEDPVMTLVHRAKGKDAVMWALGQTKKAKEKVKKPGLSMLIKRVRFISLEIKGELGVKDDPCLAALGVGMLMSGAWMAIPTLLKYTDNRRPPDTLNVRITPRVDGDSLRLNLTGIAECRPIHIISAIVLWEWNNRKGKKAAWRILSKTS